MQPDEPKEPDVPQEDEAPREEAPAPDEFEEAPMMPALPRYGRMPFWRRIFS